MLGERALRAVREAAPHIACTAETAANAGRQGLHMVHHLRDDAFFRELTITAARPETAGRDPSWSVRAGAEGRPRSGRAVHRPLDEVPRTTTRAGPEAGRMPAGGPDGLAAGPGMPMMPTRSAAWAGGIAPVGSAPSLARPPGPARACARYRGADGIR